MIIEYGDIKVIDPTFYGQGWILLCSDSGVELRVKARKDITEAGAVAKVRRLRLPVLLMDYWYLNGEARFTCEITGAFSNDINCSYDLEA